MAEYGNAVGALGATDGGSGNCHVVGTTGTSESSPTSNQTQAYDLHISGRKTGVAVERDCIWPGMWRVRLGTDMSDITNISRAKDASIAWARPKGLGGDEDARWHHRQRRVAAPPTRSSGRRAA